MAELQNLLLRQRLERHLAIAQKRIKQEIKAYPAPIPACDAQYNHLLALRRTLDRACAELAQAREPTQLLDIASQLAEAGFLDAADKAALKRAAES